MQAAHQFFQLCFPALLQHYKQSAYAIWELDAIPSFYDKCLYCFLRISQRRLRNLLFKIIAPILNWFSLCILKFLYFLHGEYACHDKLLKLFILRLSDKTFDEFGHYLESIKYMKRIFWCWMCHPVNNINHILEKTEKL